MLKNKFLPYFFAIIFMNLSCAHFQNSSIRSFKKNITHGTISEFPKYFETQASRIFVGNKHELTLNNNKISLQKIISDSNSSVEAVYVKATFSEDTISFYFHKNTEITEVVRIEAKLKRNGFIKLKNTETNCQGIPYLFGGCDQRKIRIAFSRDGKMIVQEAVSNTGAFLFIFGTGYSYNAVYIFAAKN